MVFKEHEGFLNAKILFLRKASAMGSQSVNNIIIINVPYLTKTLIPNTKYKLAPKYFLCLQKI